MAWRILWDCAWPNQQRTDLPPLPSERDPIPRQVRQQVYDRDGHTCQLCGVTTRTVRPVLPLPGDARTLDHIVPKSMGGDHTAGNLQVACWDCNNQKGATA